MRPIKKLTQLVHNFREQHLTNKMIRELHDYELLRTFIPKVFPNENSLMDYLKFSKLLPDINTRDIYRLINVPFHTRDNVWLAAYLDLLVNYTCTRVKKSTINTFVKTDPEFNHERQRFENDIVRCEIRYYLADPKNDKTFKTQEYISEKIIKSLVTNFHIPAQQVHDSIQRNCDLFIPNNEKIS